MANFDLSNPEPTIIDNGVSGICTTNSNLSTFKPASNTSISIETSFVNSVYGVSVTTIPNVIIGSSTLNWDSSSTLASNQQDESSTGFGLPFPIQYFGTSYTAAYISTNFYIAFGGDSYVTYPSASSPALPKILISASDRGIQRYFIKTTGIVGSRIRTIRIEGSQNRASGIVGAPDMSFEVSFFEATPNKIELHIDKMSTVQVYNTVPVTTSSFGYNSNILFKETTATGFINPVFSSVARTSNNIAISYNYNIANLDSPVTGSRSSTPGVLTGRRPKFGQLFPRGYFNR